MKKRYIFALKVLCLGSVLCAMEEEKDNKAKVPVLSEEEQAEYLKEVNKKFKEVNAKKLIQDNPPIDTEKYLQDVLNQLARIKKEKNK